MSTHTDDSVALLSPRPALADQLKAAMLAIAEELESTDRYITEGEEALDDKLLQLHRAWLNVCPECGDDWSNAECNVCIDSMRDDKEHMKWNDADD